MAILERFCEHCSKPVPVRKGPRRYCDAQCRKAKNRCTFSECPRPLAGDGLCNGHLEQRRRGRPLTPLRPVRPRGSTLLRDEQGRKWCPMCRRWLETDEFNSHVRTPDGLTQHCRACSNMGRRLKRFNVTEERWLQMLNDQDGLCALCQSPPSPSKALCFDHDPRCCPEPSASCGRCVRALLCDNCNTGMGKFRDDPRLLTKAAAYIEQYRHDPVR